MLSERAEAILQETVDHFISTGEATASRHLAVTGRNRWSSATLRSELAQLEEKGFLVQRHVSGGRFPTESGIHYYIDHLVRPEMPEGAERELLRGLHAAASWDETVVVRRTSSLLSELAGETACALWWRGREVFVEGRLRLLAKPEYRSASQLRAVLGLMEDRRTLASLLERAGSTDGVAVCVGRDNPELPVRDLALVVASCRRGTAVEGTLGVIGSVRMQYRSLIPLVGLTARLMGETLGRRERRGHG